MVKRDFPGRPPAPAGLLPEDIVATVPRGQPAGLVDAWGRRFALGPRVRIGRDPERVEIAVFAAAVSLIHAEVWQHEGRWMLRDLGSTNGTYVDGQRIEEPVPLQFGQVLVVGDVGFLFVSR